MASNLSASPIGITDDLTECIPNRLPNGLTDDLPNGLPFASLSASLCASLSAGTPLLTLYRLQACGMHVLTTAPSPSPQVRLF